MKYSIAPLKQTNETIMVFQKKYKTGSCMHDVIAMENGDDSITCGALDIENNRVGSESTTRKQVNTSGNFVSVHNKDKIAGSHNGRFPSQTICDSETAAILDGQSGVSKTTKAIKSKAGNNDGGKNSLGNFNIKYDKIGGYNDTAGCSKILHKCNYENNDYDIYNYCAKVSNAERGSFNNHPTVKPISLLRRILSYFKTPNEQIVLDCFAGSGSMQIACIEENMNFIGYELNTEYFEIAEKRIFAAQQQLKLF